MSEHEGFGVPLVEAMAADLPVLAFGAAAVPETMGGRGIVFDEKHFAALAEVVQWVTTDTAMREKLRRRSARARRRALLRRHPRRAGDVPAPARRGSAAPARDKPKLAIVVQRYGEELTGGAEAHARQVAQHLAPHAKVEVLTTCAADHLTWANELPAGRARDGALTVHRFPVRRPRRMREFNRLSDAVFGSRRTSSPRRTGWRSRGRSRPGCSRPSPPARPSSTRSSSSPTSTRRPRGACRWWRGKALVVPTAHDEPPLRSTRSSDVFTTPRALLCNTPEEVALIERRFPRATRRRVVGVGIEPQPAKPQRFRDTFGITGPYLLYLGRMEAGKGVVELVRRHQALVSAFHDAPALVLAGAGDVKPQGTRVICVGRIDEQAKWDALAGALAVVVPSRYESLSLLTLEAFAVGTPVIGNAASEVVVGQLKRSGGGVSFDARRRRELPAKPCSGWAWSGPRWGGQGRSTPRSPGGTRWCAAYLEEIEQIRRKS